MNTLIRRFSAVAASHPSSIAVTSGADSLSYAELDYAAEQLARRLWLSGAGPETIVGVSVPRSVDLIVALLAVLKSGAAYLPLDPTYPESRLEYLLEDAAPVAIVSSPEVKLPSCNVPRIDTSLRASDEEAGHLRCELGSTDTLTPGNTAYVIYTSGSTGKPKGVVVPHRAVLQLLDSAISVLRIGPDDVWTAFHSYAFDFSVWEIWGPLLTGGRVVVVPAEATWSGEDLLRLAVDERVTVLSQTPSAFAAFDKADAVTSLPLEDLRLVVFGGEPLDVGRLSGWFLRRDKQPQLVNMYGITETTVHVTAGEIDMKTAEAERGSPIGQLLPGFSAMVLDEDLEETVDDQVGELYLGGNQLARGYYSRPSLTATRFVADPSGSGERVYRTGDLVYKAGNGFLHMGRADTQLSLRGFRIEPGEIEAALGGVDGIIASSVAVQPDPDSQDGDECIAAYVVTVDGTLDEWVVRSQLNTKLPAHLVPTHIVTVADLPRTPNGKLDRQALPKLRARRDRRMQARDQLLQRRLATRSKKSGERTTP